MEREHVSELRTIAQTQHLLRFYLTMPRTTSSSDQTSTALSAGTLLPDAFVSIIIILSQPSSPAVQQRKVDAQTQRPQLQTTHAATDALAGRSL